MGDFNIERINLSLKAFLNSNSLCNLIKSNTYFKGKGSCIDFFPNNRKYSFTLVAHMKQVLEIIII